MKLHPAIVAAAASCATACSGEIQVTAKAPVAEIKVDTPAPKPALQLKGAQIDIKGDIEFDKDQATIKDTAGSREVLGGVLKILQDHPELQKLRIEGHTDSDGSAAHNEKLSQDRAAAAEKWLIDHGIADERIDPVGCGAKDPLVPNDSPEHKAQNRRTEFDVEQLGGKQPDGYTQPCAPNPNR